MAIHAIGDKAVASSLDAIEASIDESRRKRIRHRIEHAQMIHPDDIRRFKELGVIASVQPGHCLLYTSRTFGTFITECAYK